VGGPDALGEREIREEGEGRGELVPVLEGIELEALELAELVTEARGVPERDAEGVDEREDNEDPVTEGDGVPKFPVWVPAPDIEEEEEGSTGVDEGVTRAGLKVAGDKVGEEEVKELPVPPSLRAPSTPPIP